MASKKKIAFENAKNVNDVFKARDAASAANSARELEMASKAAAGGAEGIPGSLRSFLNKVPAGAAIKEFGKEAALTGAKTLPFVGNAVSAGLAGKGLYDMATDPSQRTLGRAAETALDAVGAIPVLGNASNTLRFGSRAAQLGSMAAGGLRAALGTDDTLPPVSVDPAEVAAIRAQRQDAAPKKNVDSMPPIGSSLEDDIARRAGNVEDLRGAVSTAQGAYDNAMRQGMVDANAQRIPGMAGFALASAPMRAAPEAQDLKSAMRDYALAKGDQAHDDKTGIDLATMRAQTGLAQAKMIYDMRERAMNDVEKFKPATMLNDKGIPVEDMETNALAQRMAAGNGRAGELDPVRRAQGLQSDASDASLVKRYNDVASHGLRQNTPLNIVRTDTVGLGDVMRGGAGFGAMLRGKFMPGVPNEVAVNRTPDGQEQRILTQDLTGGNAAERRYALRNAIGAKQ